MSNERRVGRRGALMGVGATVMGAAIAGPRLAEGLGGASEPSAASASGGAVTPSAAAAGLGAPDASVRALFGELREGSAISTHWRLEALYAPRAGAIPVVMSTLDGQRFGVEIFKDDPAGATPVARARGLALYLVNHGDGDEATSESIGRGVMALGQALGARRGEGAPIPAALTSHAERMARGPGGEYDFPLA